MKEPVFLPVEFEDIYQHAVLPVPNRNSNVVRPPVVLPAVARPTNRPSLGRSVVTVVVGSGGQQRSIVRPKAASLPSHLAVLVLSLVYQPLSIQEEEMGGVCGPVRYGFAS